MAFSPLVSVVVPTFNTAAYVVQAVQSILGQTYEHLEVHVIDDGSTDGTKAALETIADSRFHYHYQENRGESGARNAGIRAARGELIALCDADDLWEPIKLEVQVPRFEGRPGLGVVYTDTVHVDEGNRELPTYRTTRHSGWITRKLFLENFVTGSTSMFRRECFDADLYDESFKTCADYDLSLRLSVKYEFEYLDTITYRYRMWPGQVSNPRNRLRFIEDELRMRRKFMEKHPELVDSSLVKEMWARTLSSRALAAMSLEGVRRRALPDAIRALRFGPLRSASWKAVGKVLLDRAD